MAPAVFVAVGAVGVAVATTLGLPLTWAVLGSGWSSRRRSLTTSCAPATERRGTERRGAEVTRGKDCLTHG